MTRETAIRVFWLLCECVCIQVEEETANFLRWSINTCKLTSSVRMGAPLPSWGGVEIQWIESLLVKVWMVLTYCSPSRHGVVSLRGVHFREEKTGLKGGETERVLGGECRYVMNIAVYTWLPPFCVTMYLGIGNLVCRISYMDSNETVLRSDVMY